MRLHWEISGVEILFLFIGYGLGLLESGNKRGWVVLFLCMSVMVMSLYQMSKTANNKKTNVSGSHEGKQDEKSGRTPKPQQQASGSDRSGNNVDIGSNL